MISEYDFYLTVPLPKKHFEKPQIHLIEKETIRPLSEECLVQIQCGIRTQVYWPDLVAVTETHYRPT